MQTTPGVHHNVAVMFDACMAHCERGIRLN